MKINTTAVNAQIGFAATVGVGYFSGWAAKDLIWGLWLSSLCLGMIVFVAQLLFWPALKAKSLAGRIAVLVGGGFMLAFFTVHYGMFHFGHSVFLNMFFPIEGIQLAEGARPDFVSPEMYEKVVLTYWPVALIAAWVQRELFMTPGAWNPVQNQMGVYKNVVRMHLLIFILAGFAAMQFDSFWAYAAACMLYFFPWHIVRRGKNEASAARS